MDRNWINWNELLMDVYCITYKAYGNNKDCVIKLWRQKEPKESLVMIELR